MLPLPKNTLTERAVNRLSDEVVISASSPSKRTDLKSGIPVSTTKHNCGSPEQRSLESSKRDRTASTTTTTAPSSPQKLKLQSPRKLRERLQNEQAAAAEVTNSLQTELRLIGTEMSALTLRSTTTAPTTTSHPLTLETLSARLAALEASLPAQIGDLSVKQSALQAELESSLLASERKVRNIDKLYQEASRENEALYDRFNDELSKVLKNVQQPNNGQGAVEELKRKLREAQEESRVLRRENVKLKRERAGLRALVRE